MKLSLERVEHLKKGLEEVIYKVKDNPKEEYNMLVYNHCVIGNNFNVNGYNQAEKIEDLFGIVGADLVSDFYYAGKTKLESSVLKLFTTKVCGENTRLITKEDWLKEANKVLKKLDKAITKRSNFATERKELEVDSYI